jgi:hypothetical protein
MLGSVANHAWAEDSLYVKINRQGLAIERESKHTNSGSFTIGHIRNKAWEPAILDEKGDLDEHADEAGNGQIVRTAKPRVKAIPQARRNPKAIDALRRLGPGAHSTAKVAAEAGLTLSGARKQLQRSHEVMGSGGKWIVGSE